MEQERIFFDDIGSYPLPRGVKLDGLSRDRYLQLVGQVLAEKISAGVEIPTYPQLRDMIRMFMDPIKDPKMTESPFLIRREEAKIMELEAVPPGQKVRVCVTGPVELYISAFGATGYTDILYTLAESVSRFLEWAKEEGKMAIASLDEPSLGLNSNIIFSEEEIQEALEIASRPCQGMHCEVHLHSPLYAELCAHVSGIDILGVESAAHPDYLKLIEREVLEDTGTYLRAGIARTDIFSLSAQLNDRYKVNLWEDLPRLEREITSLESPLIMKSRLDQAYAQFGDRLIATGPDCGLGPWPSQELAGSILGNCAAAIAFFRSEHP
ncbi:MAG: 5-methyltetrahydropteroyltriglutamate--homocysteine methyltransferase [Methanothrix soehngenii]|jgi:5-methyltetrahydropteroyltriglutamate--homocysteine methyltransferase|uniref:5-methyltetrahydropteroyltriglutamate-- homocysteine methyltransferase n=2 Tax=Methanotrichaceae TaxID=143067 RepID=UPI001E7A5C1B|nr:MULTISPECIES: 5-methyltetrahydropteroyltriglutamate--homocysteine methyltransferase [Methanothrix]MCK9586729.1 5-methyltetrahydropteroyltriglutamate--homocysteine methyltransferase [Methanothrix soehngenii]MDD3973348.1 5-methyltetrahydropteroyltriglutamate--homocysteine methyltransferase [Methanothrix soehngenii]MDD4488042.1 5-methyltetrahydropteroyltriglutamate--homocysteine methyltransferase [Methanothrix soehngenii]MDD5258065.1 5-methyltetrahydropteroyltriglutamate--homocysteine methyltra